VKILYSGSGGNGSVYLYQSAVPVISSEISYGSSYGIYISYCSPLIEGNTISNNGSYGLYHYSYYSSSPEFRNNIVTNNADGIYMSSNNPKPVIEGNTITDNSGWGIYYENAPASPVISGNTITGNFRSMIIPASSLPNSTDGNILAPNSVNGVWIRGNTRNSDLRLEALYAGEEHELNTYQIYGTMTMNSGVSLTVDPGVIVKFYSSAGLTINGGLDAQGTLDLPVVFTSYKDDQYGGDHNLDGYSTTPVNGDWRSIYFTNQADDGACVIDNAVIRYGGSSNSGMIYANQTNFPITNSVISNSSTNGIRSYQSSLTLANNEVFSNIGDGLYLESSGTHTMTGMRIFANFGDGIEVRNSVSSAVTDSEIFGKATASGTVRV
jgi:parallel beta-helix repeat protein